MPEIVGFALWFFSKTGPIEGIAFGNKSERLNLKPYDLSGYTNISATTENSSNPLNHLFGRNLFHAGMVVRALAEPAKIARGAGEVGPDDGFRSPVGSDPSRIGGTEDADHGTIQRHGQ